LRNHTAKSSGITTTSPVPVPNLHRTPTRARSASPRTSVLLVSLAGVFGLAGLAGAAPSALAAEPSGLPQAYSAKVVDTASLTTSATSAPAASGSQSAPVSQSNVAPVVSMLPVPKADPASAVTVPKAEKRKAKKVVPTTPGAPALSQEALAVPAAKLQLSKTPDTKAPAEGAKESPANSSLDAAFAALRKCESGGNYKIATGNGYYGAYQFDPRTWRALGYTGLPSDAPPEVQDEAARKLLAKAGWGQWPACSRKLGLR
jgi:Transglycosylase-like domain